LRMRRVVRAGSRRHPFAGFPRITTAQFPPGAPASLPVWIVFFHPAGPARANCNDRPTCRLIVVKKSGWTLWSCRIQPTPCQPPFSNGGTRRGKTRLELASAGLLDLRLQVSWVAAAPSEFLKARGGEKATPRWPPAPG
jgi:hypothetical protein